MENKDNDRLSCIKIHDKLQSLHSRKTGIRSMEQRNNPETDTSLYV